MNDLNHTSQIARLNKANLFIVTQTNYYFSENYNWPWHDIMLGALNRKVLHNDEELEKH